MQCLLLSCFGEKYERFGRMTSSGVTLVGRGDRPTFVNTGVHLFNVFDYLFDADRGIVGYRRNGRPSVRRRRVVHFTRALESGFRLSEGVDRVPRTAPFVGMAYMGDARVRPLHLDLERGTVDFLKRLNGATCQSVIPEFQGPPLDYQHR
jgi:hypothetical protein